MRPINPKFKKTFDYYPEVPDLTQEALWNYLAYGIPPGGFLTAFLKNDLFTTLVRADALWSGRGLKNLAKWIINYMPPEAYGSDSALDQWISKTQQERTDRMIELGLRPDVVEILSGKEER